MTTCVVRYLIDPGKISDFEVYARRWVSVVLRLGGTHHGYYLPGEGANNVALCLFSFPSLAAYEVYREEVATDTECMELAELAKQTGCIVSYERTFMKPLAC